MPRAELKHINTVTKRLADGSVKRYYYHRTTGAPLAGVYGSPAFFASYAAAETLRRDGRRKRVAGTIKSLMIGYYASVDFTGLRPSTQKEYRRLLRTVEDQFGDLEIAALGEKGCRNLFLSWRDDLAATGKLREADNRLTVFAAMLSWAKNTRGVTEQNPLEGFKRSYKSDRSEMIWTSEHIVRFTALASSEMALALYVALYTGQRQDDLLKLQWNAYRDGKLYVKQSKGQKPVVVPCIEQLRTLLDNLQAGARTSTHILTTPSGVPWKKRHFSSLFKAASVAAGIEDLHFHDLRGTAITTLADAGCSLPEIVAITGHELASAAKILKKYLATTDEQARSAMAKLENHLRTKAANCAANQTAVPDAGVA